MTKLCPPLRSRLRRAPPTNWMSQWAAGVGWSGVGVGGGGGFPSSPTRNWCTEHSLVLHSMLWGDLQKNKFPRKRWEIQIFAKISSCIRRVLCISTYCNMQTVTLSTASRRECAEVVRLRVGVACRDSLARFVLYFFLSKLLPL